MMLALQLMVFMVFMVCGSLGSLRPAGAQVPLSKSQAVPSEGLPGRIGPTRDGPTEDSQQESDGADRDQINRLIQQLGSPAFAIRQSATEQLWQFGPAAQPQLERAAAQGDPEVAKRASEILSVLALGVDAKTSPKVAKLVLNFNFSEAAVREDILEHLIREEQLRLVYDLLGQIKNVQDQGAMFHEVMDFNETLIRLARADRWDDFEFVLGHPITLEHERAAGVHFHLVNGTLPTILERLDQTLQTRDDNGEPVAADEWLRVIAIYRLQRRFDEAETLARKITEADIKRQVLIQIVLEKGDWNEIARRMADPDETVRPDDGKIVVTSAQAALVNQLIGNPQGYDHIVARLAQQTQQLEQAENLEGARQIRATLVEIGLANLDWPLVENNMDREDTQQAFNLYVDHQRIEQAFQVVGFEGDLLQRNVWFNRKVQNIKSLTAKADRLKKKGEDTDEVDADLRGAWQLCLEVADRLGGLGMTDEAVLHYHTLFSAMVGEENQSRRIGIIGRLIFLERYREAWNLVEGGIEATEIRRMYRFFFPSHQQTAASYWNTILVQRYPNPVERLKAVSGMLNSPLGTLPNFDLEVELAGAQANPSLYQLGYLDLQFASVHEYHGNFDASLQHLNLAKRLGNENAKRILAGKALQQNDFALAAEFYESAWRYRASAFDACLAAEAIRKLGESKKAALRQCVAYAYWRDSYRNSAAIESLEFINKSHLIADFMKLDIYCINGKGIANERYRDVLAAAQFELAPAVSAIEKQLILFNQCGRSEPGSRLLSDWGESRKQINLATAKVKIAQGQFEEAVELLIRCNEFAPGDPGLGESLILELDRAGATLQADRLFENLTTFYVGILERYPDSPLHHNNYAWLCASAKRRMRHMLRHAQKAVEERPNTSSYLDTLATIYFLRSETQKAIELCRRCIELDPIKQHYRDQLKLFESE